MAEEIAKLLAKAGDAELVAVMAMVDSVPSRATLETEIDTIRPKLAMLRPPRPASFNRVLVTPFEDMLVPDAQWLPDTMLIARSNLTAITKSARAVFSQTELNDLAVKMQGWNMSDIDRVCQLGADIWLRSAEGIASKAEQAERSSNGISLREQCQNTIGLLTVADLICPMMQVLPARPMGDLTAYQIEAVKDCLKRCEERSIEGFVAALQWLIARSFKPTVILNLLLRQQVGHEIANREDLAHSLAVQILKRQGRTLRYLATRGHSLAATTTELEQAAGSFLAVAEKARQLDLTSEQLAQTRKTIQDVIIQKLEHALTESYMNAVDRLDDPAVTDKDVEDIEVEARSMNRLATLADVCGGKSRLDQLLEDAAEEAASELRGRYGAKADPMIVVDQLRTFELVFGGDHARKLWLEFARRSKSMEGVSKRKVSVKSEPEIAAHAMMSAINSLYAVK